jgi:hypothetical protein
MPSANFPIIPRPFLCYSLPTKFKNLRRPDEVPA